MKKADQEKYTINAAAKLLTVDPRTLAKWLGDSEPAGHRHGVALYTLAQCSEAIRSYRDKRPKGSSARDRYMNAMADRAEFEIAVRKKEYVLASDVERWGAEIGMNVRKVTTKLHLAAPSVVGVSVPEAEERLKEIEDEILHQLHSIEPGALACPHCSRNFYEKPAAENPPV
jgi:hypothetical protein